jgi:pimeloyl-ACP methyl ester carboxylesterase
MRARPLGHATHPAGHAKALVPGAQRIVLDAGHAPHVSQPQALAEALIPPLKTYCG